MTIKPIAAEYWYHHKDDPQSMRALPQMGAGHQTEAEVLAEVAHLRQLGYVVQRATVADTCTACNGAGRIGTAPKGTRKVKIASLPPWRLTWRTCEACKGEGVLNPRELACELPEQD